MTVLPQLYVQYVRTYVVASPCGSVQQICWQAYLIRTYIHMYISATSAAHNTDVHTCVRMYVCTRML